MSPSFPSGFPPPWRRSTHSACAAALPSPLIYRTAVFIRRGPRESPLLASCGTDFTPLQDFISRTRITKRITALTDNPAREEEFGTTRLAKGAAIAGPSVRARVLPLLMCTSARRDRRGAQRSLDLTVRHSDSRRPAAPIPSPKETRRTQTTLARSVRCTQTRSIEVSAILCAGCLQCHRAGLTSGGACIKVRVWAMRSRCM